MTASRASAGKHPREVQAEGLSLATLQGQLRARGVQ